MQTVSAEIGLTQAQVLERVAAGQINDVPPAPSRTFGQIFRANALTRFNAMLGAMLVIILIVGPPQDALFGVVLVANTLIGIVQELRAKRTLERISLLAAPKARIVRDGVVAEMPVSAVVQDDVLELRAGDQVVVDGRVLTCDGLEIDESLITGESRTVEKKPGDAVLSGSFAVAGSGRSCATKIGREAYAATLADEARRYTVVRSDLRAGTDTLLRLITWAIIPTAALLFFGQLRSHSPFHEVLRGTVAGVVGMIPEGLVLLTSIAFGLGAVRLARRRVLVQELAAVEGLARVDVLCVDKTGTLTEGRLSFEGLEPLAGANRAECEAALAALAAADSSPNATMHAIAEKFPSGSPGWNAASRVPFSSARKWSGANFGTNGSWMLGAPEVLAGPATEASARAAAAAAGGSRVLLLARSRGTIDAGAPPAEGEVRPVALVTVGDVPRADAAETIRYFGEQGVALKVISGDNPATVSAIATRLGVPDAGASVDARELVGKTSEDLQTAMHEYAVFGRVAPQQKRDMVKALQALGHTVAMTGDGVNDVLALKDADLGIAMGSGSQATRAVAQLVLLDSTFSALPGVVSEGRRVLGNIQRTSNLYVTKTVYVMLIAIATGALAFVFPFLPRHLTLVGALTIGIPSFFLALAPSSERTKPGFLKRVMRFSIPAGSLAAIATFLGYSLARSTPGVSLQEAQTTATMVLCWIGLLVLSIVASPLNRWKLGLIWSMAGAFLLILLVPATAGFFHLKTPPAVVWLAAFGLAAIVWSFARLFVPSPPGDSGVPLMQ